MHPLKVKGVVFEGILNFINNSIYLFNLKKEGGEKKRGTTARLVTRGLFTQPECSSLMNGAKVKRCVLSGPVGSINNKIAVLTLGFLSLTGSVSARRGSTIIGQTATAMVCHLNFASSTPALCLRPLPDVNIFLLFELRDLLKEQTPGMLCSFVTKL